MYVCMYVCMYACMYVYINGNKSMNITMYMNIPTYIFVLCVWSRIHTLKFFNTVNLIIAMVVTFMQEIWDAYGI